MTPEERTNELGRRLFYALGMIIGSLWIGYYWMAHGPEWSAKPTWYTMWLLVLIGILQVIGVFAGSLHDTMSK